MSGFEDEIRNLKRGGVYRELRNIDRVEGKIIYMGGKKYIDFSSNNYLGLRDDDRIKKKAIEAIEKYGVGSGGSRLVTGTADVFRELEKKIAVFKKKEAAIIFNSGYDANLGVISTICGKKDVVFCDKLNHASIYDGIFLSGAKMVRYKHNDMLDLRKKVKKYRCFGKKGLLVTDTVFSMDGDRAKLNELVDLKKEFDLMFMIDEAHGGGVLGKNGAGLAEEEGLLSEIDINMGTFGKAFGGQGAYVAASSEIVDYLINKTKSLIYTTALSPVLVSANLKALEIIKNSFEKREKLKELSTYLRAGLERIGLSTLGSTTNIVPIIIGDNNKVLELSEKLHDKGFVVPAIRAPTVNANSSRLRVSVSSEHSFEDVENFLIELSSLIKS